MLPITAYGHPTLRKKTEKITRDYEGLNDLIDKMFGSMYESRGVGLAAPQVNKSIRLFIVDATPYASEEPSLKDFKEVFINPQIIDESGKEWAFNEGCLSIPDIREDVERKPEIRIQYYDRDFNFQDKTFSGIAARIIQHEYDHLEGILFTDRVSPLRKMLLKRKLMDISKGNIQVDYKMLFPPIKKNKTKRIHM